MSKQNKNSTMEELREDVGAMQTKLTSLLTMGVQLRSMRLAAS